MWVNPIGTIRQVFTQAADYAVEGHDHNTFFNGTIYYSGDISLVFLSGIFYLADHRSSLDWTSSWQYASLFLPKIT